MIAGTFVRALPAWVLWLALTALVAASAGWGYTRGATAVQDRWDAATIRQSRTVAIVRQRQAEVTERVVTEYVDRVRVIEREADAVIREVPVYVQDHCEPDGRLPAGVRWVLNAAACAGRCPAEPAGTADGAGAAAGAPAGQQ
ncbi:hypothetical protein [Methyloversatilis sp.]|jgi:hypothetical protein|uniref:hypothetical protein n=1 Tax=Methyloversatilis sp. TaxID=2569862 RepID=UPI0035B28A79